MKSNKPLIIGVIAIVLAGGVLVATGGYERFISIDDLGVEYAELSDRGYPAGFNYQYLDSGENQEELKEEYLRENPGARTEFEDCELRFDRVSATNSSNEIINFGLQGNALYPGAMVLATQTEVGAALSIPAVQRGSATFSINQEGSQVGTITADVDHVNQSEVRTAINSIITGKDLSKFATVIDYDYQTIKSSKEMNLQVGAKVDIGNFINIENRFSSGSNESTTKAVMVIKQICFEVTMDHPEKLSGFFDSSWATKSKIESAFGSESTPLYVSGVAYGRLLIITAESTMDEANLKNTLTSGFSKGYVNGNISNAIENMRGNTETRITVQIVGGNTTDSIEIIENANGILDGDVKSILDNFTYTSATPIQYRLSNLDGSTAMIQNANEYVIMTLKPNYNIALNWDTIQSAMKKAGSGTGVDKDGKMKIDLSNMTIPQDDVEKPHHIQVPSNVNILVLSSSKGIDIRNFHLEVKESLSDFTLILENLNLYGEDEEIISFSGRPHYNLVIDGNTLLVADENCSAIFSGGDTTITVSRDLTITGGEITTDFNSTESDHFAVYCKGKLTIDGTARLTITGGTGAEGDSKNINGRQGASAIFASSVVFKDGPVEIKIYGGTGGKGADGIRGDNGKDAKYQDIFHVSGKDGKNGSNGGHGGLGGHVIISDSITSHSNSVKLYLGSGGKGGNGGAGGNGGEGSSSIISYGSGGDGGNGGRGGDGGTSGPKPVVNGSIDIVAPTKALGGIGGSGGTGGKGGTYAGFPNSDGNAGKDGKNGGEGAIL